MDAKTHPYHRCHARKCRLPATPGGRHLGTRPRPAGTAAPPGAGGPPPQGRHRPAARRPGQPGDAGGAGAPDRLEWTHPQPAVRQRAVD